MSVSWQVISLVLYCLRGKGLQSKIIRDLQENRFGPANSQSNVSIYLG